MRRVLPGVRGPSGRTGGSMSRGKSISGGMTGFPGGGRGRPTGRGMKSRSRSRRSS